MENFGGENSVVSDDDYAAVSQLSDDDDIIMADDPEDESDSAAGSDDDDVSIGGGDMEAAMGYAGTFSMPSSSHSLEMTEALREEFSNVAVRAPLVSKGISSANVAAAGDDVFKMPHTNETFATGSRRISSNRMTRYEFASIIGERATQLSKLSPEEAEKTVSKGVMDEVFRRGLTDPLDIAFLEIGMVDHPLEMIVVRKVMARSHDYEVFGVRELSLP